MVSACVRRAPLHACSSLREQHATHTLARTPPSMPINASRTHSTSGLGTVRVSGLVCVWGEASAVGSRGRLGDDALPGAHTPPPARCGVPRNAHTSGECRSLRRGWRREPLCKRGEEKKATSDEKVVGAKVVGGLECVEGLVAGFKGTWLKRIV